jgi:sirohydrochlorin ferrochelatase
MNGPAVAVPLMLGRGYHTMADIPGRVGHLTRRLIAHSFVASIGPALPDVVRDLRSRGARRVAISSYLLAPGH